MPSVTSDTFSAMNRKQKAEELKGRIDGLREQVKDKRNRQDDAKTDARADDLADQIDALAGELNRLVPRYKKVLRKIERAANRRKDYASKNFRYSEFDCNNGQKIPEASKPAVREWCRRIGEPARAKFGPVGITSGFRPSAYNASIGGATNSVHIWDYPGRECKAVAVDWYAASGGPRDWYDFAEGKADGRGYYPNSGFTHSDTRNNIGWPDATWSG